MVEPAVNIPNSDLIERLRQTCEDNQKKLNELQRKTSRMSTHLSTFECSKEKMAEIGVDGYFRNIKSDEFTTLLNPLIRCFLSDTEFPHYTDIFKKIFEKEYNVKQFRVFAKRLSIHLLLKKDSIQRKYIARFLNLITLNRIKTVVAHVFPPENFDVNLLSRIKADSLALPGLSNYESPRGVVQELQTIWKICIEDIDNFLEGFAILTAAPINGSDAMNLCNVYEKAMKIIVDSSHNSSLVFIPFMMNALQKLYVHYIAKTPSLLPPLLVFSDPNFYQTVAPIHNRDYILSEISRAWQQRVTPILVGEPGCGKTSILIEVARRIHQKIFFDLTGSDYKVFGGSATSLINAGGMFSRNNHIDRILKKIADKREHTILLLDEIHAFKEAQKTLLRSYFDDSPLSVRYAVFATTQVGADEFFKGDDGSLERRFVRIVVPDLNTHETELALHHQARVMAPIFIVDSNVITQIVEKAKGNFTQSRKTLCQVLREASKQNTACPSQKSYDDKLTELSLAREEHVKQVSLGRNKGWSSTTRINQLERDRRELEEKLKSERLIINNHFVLITKRTQVIFKIFDISQGILKKFQNYLISQKENLSQLAPDTEQRRFTSPQFQNEIVENIKEFIYYNFFLKNAFIKRIKEFEKEHGLISEITDDFVTENMLNTDSDELTNVVDMEISNV